MNKNKIIAVVGMCGSGKSVAVEEFEKSIPVPLERA